MALVMSILLVAVASWVRRTVPLVMVWSTIFLFARGVSAVVVDNLKHSEHWRLIDMWNNIRIVGRVFLGFAQEEIPPQPQPAVWEAALVLVLVTLICLSYLNLRTRAVEIVR
jgi:hypothetical protein